MQDLCFIMQDIPLQHMDSVVVAVGSLVMVCSVSSHGCGLSSRGCGLSSRGCSSLVVAVGSLVVLRRLQSAWAHQWWHMDLSSPTKDWTPALILQCGILTTGPPGKCLPSTLGSPFLPGSWAEFSPPKEAISVWWTGVPLDRHLIFRVWN